MQGCPERPGLEGGHGLVKAAGGLHADADHCGHHGCAGAGLRRSLLGKKLPDEFYLRRDALEQQWFETAAHCANEDFPELSLRCLREEEAFYDAFRGYSFESARTPVGFMGRWEKKNRVFEEESRKFDEC